MMSTKTLYSRLGGYDAICAVANDLLPRLRADPQLGRFWAHRGDDGVAREKQLLIDFLCASAGGPMYYRGRDMTLAHRGMWISESDWNVFLGHAAATLAKFKVPDAEQGELVPLPVSETREGDTNIAPPSSIVDPGATVRSRFIGQAAIARARAATGV